MQQSSHEEAHRGAKKAVKQAVAIAGIIGAVAGYALMIRKGPESAMNGQTPGAPAAGFDSTAVSEISVPAQRYRNGVYVAEGEYLSPGGAEVLGVSVTLENGMIVDSSVAVKSERPISEKMQQVFAENYRSLVVGKNIDEVRLDKVSTSSLTPVGFNKALEKIKEKAKA